MYLIFLFLFLFLYQIPGQAQERNLLEGTLEAGQTDLTTDYINPNDPTKVPDPDNEKGTRTKTNKVSNGTEAGAGIINNEITMAGDLCNNPAEGQLPDEESCNRLGGLEAAGQAVLETGNQAGDVKNKLSINGEENIEIGPNIRELQRLLPIAEQILVDQGFRRNADGLLVSPTGRVLPKYTGNLTDEQLLAAGYTKESLAATRANKADFARKQRLAAAAGKKLDSPFGKGKSLPGGPGGNGKLVASTNAKNGKSRTGNRNRRASPQTARTQFRRPASFEPQDLGPKDFRPGEIDKLSVSYRGTPIGTSGSNIFRVISEKYGNASLYEPK